MSISNSDSVVVVVEASKEEANDDPNKIPVRHSRVGEEYQATIEEGDLIDKASNCTEEIECEWDYNKISADKLDEYMNRLQKIDPKITKEIFSIEKALSLLHQTGYDTEKAIEIASSDSSKVVDLDMKWDNGDSNMFEYAYLHIGNDLYEIAKFLKPKTVAQVQRHYYHWKYGNRYKRFLDKNYLISSSDEEKEEEEEEEEEEKEKIVKEEEDNTQEKETITTQPPPLKKTKN